MRVWTMVTARKADAEVADQIRSSLRRPAYNVYGIYDAVVELEAGNEKEIKSLLDQMERLPLVASNTTYVVTSPKTKEEARRKPFAYILVDAAPGQSNHVRDKFYQLEEVQKADIVLGPYDIFVEVAVDSLAELRRILTKVFGTSGLIKTVTMITLE